MDKSKDAKASNPGTEGGDLKGSSPSSVKDDKLEIVPQQEKTMEIRPNDSVPTTINRPFDSTPLDSLKTPNEIAEFANVLVNAKMCPFKTVEDATIALITGKELGLSLAATLGGIYLIEGRPSLGIHIKKGLLLQNQISFKRIRDFEDYFEFVVVKDSKPSVIGYGYLDELPEMQRRADGAEVKKKKVDIRTEYIFTRFLHTAKGVVRMTANGMFSYAMAQEAGLVDKHNWKSYGRDMLANRAFGRGASEIADDLLHGMYNFSDLADLPESGVTYWIDDDGREHIVE